MKSLELSLGASLRALIDPVSLLAGAVAALPRGKSSTSVMVALLLLNKDLLECDRQLKY